MDNEPTLFNPLSGRLSSLELLSRNARQRKNSPSLPDVLPKVLPRPKTPLAGKYSAATSDSFTRLLGPRAARTPRIRTPD